VEKRKKGGKRNKKEEKADIIEKTCALLRTIY
jgi:hypothetical protein